ncbi:MAG: 2-oxo acid dehydrogenase subunit E2 [Spirochaetaceae bacterium]|jgi:pyruvate dehydrogenase E2 component (dihydrolipoamide acetyltransferase)|nr:2-oxo acid dehydrogenase subunit E2 [Spirochaetaceae bacterium]
MANSIIMPKTGMAMEEGVIVEWRVKEGDQVHKGDIVALIETDKSTMELESDYDGIILAIRRKAGETVPVTKAIAWIGQPGETLPQEAASAGPAAPVPVEPAAPVPDTGQSAVSAGGPRPKATPAARALAKERGIALSSVSPGGKSGEIRRADVAAAPSAVTATPLARRMAEAEGIPLEGLRGSGYGGKIFSGDLGAPPGGPVAGSPARVDTRAPLTNIQRITGKRMTESRQTIPEVTENTRADVTRMLALRKELNDQLSAAGAAAKITVNDFVAAATVKALVSHPRMNSVLDGNDLIYKGSVNLGVAVATDRGLLVPVLRNAQDRGLLALSAAAADLAAKARGGKLSPDEMSGGTFTVSNVGMYGITAFTPIINPPEAGILGVCAVEDELKLDGERVVSRKKMGLSLAFDHRIVDGADAALFLKTLRELLEAPLLILT